MNTTFDGLSFEAFCRGVRRSVWNIEFSDFIPLYINDANFLRTRPLVEAALVGILHNWAAPKSMSILDSKATTSTVADGVMEAVLEVVPRLMVATVIRFMDSAEAVGKDERMALFHSEKATIAGFCYAHHMLLGLGKHYPLLVTMVDSILDKFISSPTMAGEDTGNYRHKETRCQIWARWSCWHDPAQHPAMGRYRTGTVERGLCAQRHVGHTKIPRD